MSFSLKRTIKSIEKAVVTKPFKQINTSVLKPLTKLGAAYGPQALTLFNPALGATVIAAQKGYTATKDANKARKAYDAALLESQQSSEVSQADVFAVANSGIVGDTPVNPNESLARLSPTSPELFSSLLQSPGNTSILIVAVGILVLALTLSRRK